MPVRTAAPLVFDEGHFQRADRGVTWCIEVTDAPDMAFVIVFARTAAMLLIREQGTRYGVSSSRAFRRHAAALRRGTAGTLRLCALPDGQRIVTAQDFATPPVDGT